MFAGAFLYAITQNYNFKKAGEFASLASAQIVTQFGPRLEHKEHHDIKMKVLGE